MFISHEELLRILTYNKEEGLFRWKVNRGSVKAGTIAGGVHKRTGYYRLTVKGKAVMAHRLAWFYVHAVWPDEIDHKDRKRANNVFENIQEATHQQNVFNRSKRSDNTSGRKGVSFRKSRNKYVATIKVNGKTIHLGVYVSLDDASNAYDEAAIKHFGKHALTNRMLAAKTKM